jgi:serine/threonine protein kinase
VRLRAAQNAPDDLAQLLSAAPARVQVLRELQHKNIVKLQDAYETPSSLILVCELATGGELMHRIAEERSVYTEEEVKRHLLVMLDTIKYMHNQGAPPQDERPPPLLTPTPAHGVYLLKAAALPQLFEKRTAQLFPKSCCAPAVPENSD